MNNMQQARAFHYTFILILIVLLFPSIILTQFLNKILIPIIFKTLGCDVYVSVQLIMHRQ
jgi:hypothetical protein